MSVILEFVVDGRAIPKGSMRHVGGGRMVDQTNVRPWMRAVGAAAIVAANSTGLWQITTPVEVEVCAYFSRPANQYRTGRYAGLLRDDAPPVPCTRAQGDADKLVRAVLDALEQAGVLADDSLVADQIGRKRWAVDGVDRAHVVIREVTL